MVPQTSSTDERAGARVAPKGSEQASRYRDRAFASRSPPMLKRLRRRTGGEQAEEHQGRRQE